MHAFHLSKVNSNNNFFTFLNLQAVVTFRMPSSWFISFILCQAILSIFVLESSVRGAPNVILILADDMAIGDIGLLNDQRSKTPNLNRLLQEGVWFENAYAGSPVCSPSRAALLTGRYPHRTGVVSLDMNTEPTLTRLHRDELTMADIFRKNGYRTGLIGKWHMGLGEGYGPKARGFDEFEGFHGSSGLGYFNYAIQSDDAMNFPHSMQDNYLTEELTKRSIEFVRRHASHKFFLHLAYYAPHRPLEAPKSAVQPYLESGLDEETATVYAMIEIMDRGIGELMNELDRLDIDGKTLVIFSSDNGPDSLVASRFNIGLTGTKYMVNEGGLRVPLVMSWPADFIAERRSEPIHFVDILPTIMELCALYYDPGQPLDGQSFAALFDDPSRFVGQSRCWQWNRSLPNYSHNAAVRSGPWKLLKPFVTKNKIAGNSSLPWQLFKDVNASSVLAVDGGCTRSIEGTTISVPTSPPPKPCLP
jgi:arylsulfatase A-like enzyme